MPPCTDLATLCLFKPVLGEKKQWWPVMHHSALVYRSASVPAAALLAQSRGKGDVLAGEEELSRSPSPHFQCTENPSSALQSLVEHSRRLICSCQAVSMHMPIPHRGRIGGLGNAPVQIFLSSSCSQMCCSNSRWLCMVIALYREMLEQFWSETWGRTMSTLHCSHFGFAASLSTLVQ